MDQSLVYFGPTIKSFGLEHNKCYTGLSPEAQKRFDTDPVFRSLFATNEEFVKINKELRNPNSSSSQIINHFTRIHKKKK